MTLAFWRSAFALAVHASARFPRLVPMAVVEYVDRRFYGAAMRETLRRVVTESDLEAQRRSFAYGQVAMHDPNVTREMVDAVADTMPVKTGACPRACTGTLELELASDGSCYECECCDTCGSRWWFSVPLPAPQTKESWSCLAGDLDGHDAGEIDERDLHDGEGWRVSRGQRNGWEA